MEVLSVWEWWQIFSVNLAVKYTTSVIEYQIVDPWGCVVAQCQEGTNVAVAEIDLGYRARIQQEMPVWQHRRFDLYSPVTALKYDLTCMLKYNFSYTEVLLVYTILFLIPATHIV